MRETDKSRPRRMNRIYSRVGNLVFNLILWNQPEASNNEMRLLMMFLEQGSGYVLAASGKWGSMPSCRASPYATQLLIGPNDLTLKSLSTAVTKVCLLCDQGDRALL